MSVSQVAQHVDYQDVDNLQDLQSLTAASVNDTVCKRWNHQSKKIYTWCARVLISINPLVPLGIYDDKHIQTYKHTSSQNSDAPHIFAVCKRALQELMAGNPYQDIVISGESGSGKTVAAEQVVKYIVHSSSMENGQNRGMEKALSIENASILLEAFGNARTIKNGNSSRFGKYLKLQFAPKSVDILSVTIETFLLERSRVAQPASEEGNYHILHMLWNECHGSNSAFNSQLGDLALQHMTTSSIISDGPVRGDIPITMEAFKHFGTLDQFHSIMKILAGIIHLCQIDLLEEPIAKDNPNLQKVAFDWGLHPDALILFINTQALAAPSETVITQRDGRNRTAARNSLVGLVYHRVFDWIVALVNRKASGGVDSQSNGPCIGILDIYGFEILHKNHIEQLFINWSNESLQQLFIDEVFEKEQKMYQEEGLAAADLPSPQAGRLTLQYLDKVRKIIKDCSGRGFSSDEILHEKISSLARETSISRPNTGSDPSLQFRHSGLQAPYPDFRVPHYAEQVTYSVEGMRDKVRQTDIEAIDAIITSSTSTAFLEIAGNLSSPSQHASTAKGPKVYPTLLSVFLESIQALVQKISSHDQLWIRCIKPCEGNRLGEGVKLDKEYVGRQLAACGVLEAIAVLGQGWPGKRGFDEFYKRYAPELLDPEYRGLNPKEACERILSTTFQPSSYTMGTSKVFLRDGTLLKLEQKVQKVVAARIKAAELLKLEAEMAKEAAMKQTTKSLEENEATSVSAEQIVHNEQSAGPATTASISTTHFDPPSKGSVYDVLGALELLEERIDTLDTLAQHLVLSAETKDSEFREHSQSSGLSGITRTVAARYQETEGEDRTMKQQREATSNGEAMAHVKADSTCAAEKSADLLRASQDEVERLKETIRVLEAADKSQGGPVAAPSYATHADTSIFSSGQAHVDDVSNLAVMVEAYFHPSVLYPNIKSGRLTHDPHSLVQLVIALRSLKYPSIDALLVSSVEKLLLIYDNSVDVSMYYLAVFLALGGNKVLSSPMVAKIKGTVRSITLAKFEEKRDVLTVHNRLDRLVLEYRSVFEACKRYGIDTSARTSLLDGIAMWLIDIPDINEQMRDTVLTQLHELVKR